MLTIDGSTLEGGGQLTRLALSLSAITGKAVRIHSIRAGRSSHAKRGRGGGEGRRGQPAKGGADRGAGGGLKDSHLAALEFLQGQCGARVKGAEVGSTEVVFRPAVRAEGSTLTVNEREFVVELTKPGSVWLIFQAVFPFLVFGIGRPTPSRGNTEEGNGKGKVDDGNDGAITLTLRGGTNVPKAMSTEYMTQVFFPTAERIGLPRVDVETVRRGWAGSAPEIGEVRLKIHPPNYRTNRVSDKFILPAFQLTTPSHLTKISMSLLCTPSTRDALTSALLTYLTAQFPEIPIDVPSHSPGDVQSDPSQSSSSSWSDSLSPRRLYILVVGHTSTSQRVGYDYLGPGRLARSSREEETLIQDACRTVTKGFGEQVARLATQAVDEYLQDQLVVFQALAHRSSRVGVASSEEDGVVVSTGDVDEDGDPIADDKKKHVGDESGTLHTRTVRWVCETMLAEDGVRFEAGGLCHGIGWGEALDPLSDGDDDAYRDWCGTMEVEHEMRLEANRNQD